MDGEVAQVSTRMAPAAAQGAVGSTRRTFAVGKLTWRRSEIRVVETRQGPGSRHSGGNEIVH
jgi:hypothetical protein